MRFDSGEGLLINDQRLDCGHGTERSRQRWDGVVNRDPTNGAFERERPQLGLSRWRPRFGRLKVVARRLWKDRWHVLEDVRSEWCARRGACSLLSSAPNFTYVGAGRCASSFI